MSRRFVKSLPSRAVGFEIEAELNAHSAVMDVNVAEVPTRFVGRRSATRKALDRPRWYEDFAPQPPTLPRCSSVAGLHPAVGSVVLRDDLVCLRGLAQLRPSRTIVSIPNLMGCFVFFMIALMLLVAGITMERITRNRNEAVLLAYLAQPAPFGIGQSRQHTVGNSSDLPTTARDDKNLGTVRI